jgi:hypothetical protein
MGSLMSSGRGERVPVILDTDMNEDVDDAGALAVLHALADEGRAEILGITHCTSSPWGVPAIAAINAYYGRQEIPLGTLKREGFISENADLGYPRFVSEAYPTGAKGSDAPDAVALLRRLLAGRRRRDVVLVGIGPLSNISSLLESLPDEASPLSGRALAKRAVRRLVLMCGIIPCGVEYNLRQDPRAAAAVLSSWPGRIVICDGSIGASVLTGKRFCEESRRGNPVRTSYWLHAVGLDWPSFDHLAVLVGVCGAKPRFNLSGRGSLDVDRSGRGSWSSRPFGKARYLKAGREAGRLADEIESLMIAPPRNASRHGRAWPAVSDEELLERRKAALSAHFRSIADSGLEELDAADPPLRS